MLKYAIIGCGRIAPNHIAAAQKVKENLVIVAVCDLHKDKMDNVLKHLDGYDETTVMKYISYSKMLETEKPDLVAIATESGNHSQIALECIEAGCHVIVEKPIALSIKDAEDMITAAEEKGVLLCACHQNRFNKSVQKIREAVENGRFEKMLHGAAHIRWNRGENYYEQAPWRGTWEQDGGALMNQCIHNIDLLRWMMGDDIDEVFAYTDNMNHPYIEGEDIGLAVVRFTNGSYGLIEGTTNVFPQNLEETLYLFGKTGTVKAGGKSVNIIEEWNFQDNLDDSDSIKETYRENPPNVYGYGHIPLYKNVVDSINNKKKPYVDGRAGKRALELVLAIYKSAKEGVPVKFPLKEFSTLDMR